MGKKSDGEISPVFGTLAILDGKRKTAEAKVTMPPEGSIKEAKDWVDNNEK
ncbi:MAG: DUF3787 domain-containing protein [Defluviitaleaceae bacterium]|nr:DUF3787 domain-containing protein [Defluviitaleaceae bacterium]